MCLYPYTDPPCVCGGRYTCFCEPEAENEYDGYTADQINDLFSLFDTDHGPKEARS